MQSQPPSGDHQDDTAVQLCYSLRSGALSCPTRLEGVVPAWTRKVYGASPAFLIVSLHLRRATPAESAN